MNIKHRPKSLRLSGLTDVCGKVSVYSYSYYGTMCTSYLWGTRHAQKYRYFYVATIVLASVLTLDVAVSVMDLAFALMAFPNMIAVFALAPKVMKETRRFFTMNRQGS